MSETSPGEALPPWMAPAYARFLSLLAEDRVPHALLLAGPPMIGKGMLATRMAQRLLCRSPQPDGAPCDECADCRPFLAGAHPDFRTVAPEGEGRQIRVDEIRALCAAMVLTTRGGARVALIRQAEAMNAAAANALLKTLEEPAPDTVILMLSERPASLPATVRSRVQRINLVAPSADQALPWLEARCDRPRAELAARLAASEDQPLAVLESLSEDRPDFDHEAFVDAMLGCLAGRRSPLAESGKWLRAPREVIALWALRLARDLLRVRLGLPPAVLLSRHVDLRRIAEDMTAAALVAYHDQLIRYRAEARHALNAELSVERLFLGLEALRGR
ncbi:MAG: DNA polymerase III subunit delta' [Halothiobacillaceae bacterium]